MKTESPQIVDRGRGPQLSTSRITVLDVFYYLHRSYDFDVVHYAMPSLTREEFDLIVLYVKDHYDELAQRDRKAEEFIGKGIEAQRARGGIFADSDEDLTTEQRVARLREKTRPLFILIEYL
jgi:mitochondrial fission protein ELM1